MDEILQESAQMRISSILSSGLEGEAKTNKDYFQDLADIISLAKDAGLTDEQVEQIASNYEEIISDELNHQQRFFEMVAMVSGIAPNKD